jgi:putative ABC transport system ATP-binding protein
MTTHPTRGATSPAKVDHGRPAADRSQSPGEACGKALELYEVSKNYASQPPVMALREVSLTVDAGELLAIVGPSGSGKTTLLHVMGTLERATSGTVRIDGTNAATLSDNQLAALRAHRIGFVFQQFFLAERQTALENVADGLLYAGVDAKARREQAAQALARVGLAQRERFRATQMSGGERQRVAIARALVGAPALLLADEPTGNLDTQTGDQIVELLLELNTDGTTIVVITHDHALADRLHRQVHVRDGRIISDTATDNPYADATDE